MRECVRNHTRDSISFIPTLGLSCDLEGMNGESEEDGETRGKSYIGITLIAPLNISSSNAPAWTNELPSSGCKLPAISRYFDGGCRPISSGVQ